MSDYNRKLLRNQVKPRIRLYPELSLVALRKRWDKEFSLWCEFRRLDFYGHGRISREKARKYLVPLPYSERTFSRILRSGEGYFWKLTEKDIVLYGLFRVSMFFGVRHKSPPIEIFPESFFSRSQKRSQLYCSFFKPKPKNKPANNPISRLSIKTATGIPRTSQKRYEAIVGVKKRANFAWDSGKGIIPLYDVVEGKNRLYRVHKRLGNSYERPIVKKCSQSYTRKVNRAIDGSLTKAVRQARRFFFPGKGLVKRLSKRSREKESFLWAGIGKWCLIE